MDGQNTQNEGYVVERGGQPINPTQPQTSPTSGQPQSATSGQDEPYIVEKAGSGTSDTSNAPLAGHHVTDTAFGAPSGPGMSLKGLGNAVVSGIGGALAGAGEGVFATAKGAAQLANKIPGVNIPTQKLGELAGENEPQNTAEKVGYGGETLMEFLAGDEALKGLGLADRLMKAGKIAKTLEASPRLTMALKAGAESLRAGTAQAGQTFVRTGGNAGQALKEGAEMAPIAGAGSIIGEGVKAVGEGIGKGVQAANKLTDLAGHAGTNLDTAQYLSGAINQSEEALHNEYEGAIGDYKDRLAGHELDPSDKSLPMAQQAAQLLEKPVPGDHQLETKLKDLGKEGLKPQVRDILGSIKSGFMEPIDPEETMDIKLPKNNGAETGEPKLPGNSLNKVTMNRYQYWDGSKFSTDPVKGSSLVDLKELDPNQIDYTNGTYSGEIPKDAVIPPLDPYNVDNLIGIRQLIRKRMSEFSRTLGPGDTNTRTLSSLLNSVDDTIGTLSTQAGDLSLPQEYKALRDNYRSKINIYNEPFVKNIVSGKYDADATKDFITGRQSLDKVRKLRSIVGDNAMDEVSSNIMANMLRDNTGPQGQVNPAQFMTALSKIPDDTKTELFNQGVNAQAFQNVMKDAKTARNLQYLSRVGVIGPLIASGGMYYHLGVLGSLLVAGAAGASHGINSVRNVVDYVADHPAMWKAWGMAGKATESAGEATKPVAAAVGQTVSGANQARKKQVMQGASALAGQ